MVFTFLWQFRGGVKFMNTFRRMPPSDNNIERFPKIIFKNVNFIAFVVRFLTFECWVHEYGTQKSTDTTLRFLWACGIFQIISSSKQPNMRKTWRKRNWEILGREYFFVDIFLSPYRFASSCHIVDEPGGISKIFDMLNDNNNKPKSTEKNFITLTYTSWIQEKYLEYLINIRRQPRISQNFDFVQDFRDFMLAVLLVRERKPLVFSYQNHEVIQLIYSLTRPRLWVVDCSEMPDRVEKKNAHRRRENEVERWELDNHIKYPTCRCHIELIKIFHFKLSTAMTWLMYQLYRVSRGVHIFAIWLGSLSEVNS